MDQPTAVFRMPTKTEPEEPKVPEEAGKVPAEVEEASEGAPGKALKGSESASDAPGDPEVPDASPSAPEGDARLRAAVAAWVATEDADGKDPSGAAPAADGDEAEAEGGAKAEDGAKARGEGETEVHGDEAADADEAVAAAGGDEPSRGEGDADADEPTADSSESDTPDKSVKSGEVERDRAPEGAEGGSGDGADQATAVFKAVRPRQAVDQPTTALKTVSRPESAAERTSKFVPLKPDTVRRRPDGRAAPRPRRLPPPCPPRPRPFRRPSAPGSSRCRPGRRSTCSPS